MVENRGRIDQTGFVITCRDSEFRAFLREAVNDVCDYPVVGEKAFLSDGIDLADRTQETYRRVVLVLDDTSLIHNWHNGRATLESLRYLWRRYDDSVAILLIIDPQFEAYRFVPRNLWLPNFYTLVKPFSLMRQFVPKVKEVLRLSFP